MIARASHPHSRRRFAQLFGGALGLAAVGVACRKDDVERCPRCGMRIDRASAFRAELDGHGYDSPRCALADLRARGNASASLRVQEFYSRAYVDGASVTFVGGSDVEGVMGAELVPVADDKVAKFKVDHHGARTYRLSELTADVLKREGAP